MNKIRSNISRLVAKALRQSSNADEEIEIGKIDKRQADDIKERFGIDVSGYTSFINKYAIRHVWNNHTDFKKEGLQGQIPISTADFLLIPEILKKGKVVEVATTRKGEKLLI